MKGGTLEGKGAACGCLGYPMRLGITVGAFAALAATSENKPTSFFVRCTPELHAFIEKHKNARTTSVSGGNVERKRMVELNTGAGGKALKEIDFEEGDLTLRIEAFDIGTWPDGRPKQVALFDNDKTLSINVTTAQVLEKTFGTKDTDELIGKRIVLYWDPSIRNPGGQVVGSVRVKGKPKESGKKAKGDAASEVGF